MMNKIRNIFIKSIIITIVMVLGGIMVSFITTTPEDDIQKVTTRPMLDFDDITDENREYIEYVYTNQLMEAESDTHFGVDKPISISEVAYAVVGMYEQEGYIVRSYAEYDADNVEYREKAQQYGIWFDTDKSDAAAVTRAEASAVLAPLAVDVEKMEYYTGFIGMENNAHAAQAIELYNKGIALDKRISTAYSTEKFLTKGEFAKLMNMILSPYSRISEFMPDYVDMKAQLESMINSYQGEWSLYFEDCDMGEIISINSQQMYSASLIKLFVAQSIYTRINNGTLKDTENIQDLLFKMITISDNEAWKDLAKILGNGSYTRGMLSVTELAKETGFSDTGHFFQGERKNYNFTSANDCGAYLHKLLNGEIVSPEYSEKILNLLKQQQIKVKIPSGIPEGVTVANKTGELDYIQGDAAIVYAPSGTYILVIIGDNLENSGIAQEQIRTLSAFIYEYLN